MQSNTPGSAELVSARFAPVIFFAVSLSGPNNNCLLAASRRQYVRRPPSPEKFHEFFIRHVTMKMAMGGGKKLGGGAQPT